MAVMAFVFELMRSKSFVVTFADQPRRRTPYGLGVRDTSAIYDRGEQRRRPIPCHQLGQTVLECR